MVEVVVVQVVVEEVEEVEENGDGCPDKDAISLLWELQGRRLFGSH
jgi:hypothetical protein